jgi:integrase/recombinase XerD
MTNDYIEKFKEYFIIKGYTTKSVQSISKNISYFINWIKEENIEIEEVKYNDVVAYINYKKKTGNKPRTLQLITNALNHFFNFLISEHQFNENPVSNVKIQGIKRKVLQEILTPQELETIYRSYNTENKIHTHNKIPPQKNNELAKKRNKVILGLLVYQGLKTEELTKLQLQDLQLREGKIILHRSKKTEGRTLKLESHQVFDLYDYVNDTRKQILQATGKTTTQLFISIGTSLNLANSIQKLLKNLQQTNPKLKDIKQLRISVITNWLKVHNLRKTQYMAGHRYVSSTESYQVNNIDELHENITKYHPLN